MLDEFQRDTALKEACDGTPPFWTCHNQIRLFQIHDRLLQLGVACFTPNWDSPPMWAHYASNWQGFAIEYCIRQMDMASANENSAFWQFWVNYGSRIKQTSLSELLFSPYEAVSRILSTKTLPWSYEKGVAFDSSR